MVTCARWCCYRSDRRAGAGRIKIGSNPPAAHGPTLVQVLASFPANFLFPFAGWCCAPVGLDVGGIVLMALGAQWYILFNVISGVYPPD